MPLQKKIIRLSLYLIFLFVLQEAVFRFCFPLPEIANLDRVNFMKINLDGSSSYHNRNTKRSWTSLLDTQTIFVHEMNKYAFRDSEWWVEKEPNKERVIFIGDSFVEGLMANQNETIPEAFKNGGRNKDYDVFNAGMLGCGLDSYMQLAADIIPIYKPDVVFVCIYANDLGKNKPIVPSHYLAPVYYNSYVPRLFELLRQTTTNGNILFRWTNKKDPYISPVPSPQNPWTKNEKDLKRDVLPLIANEMKKASLNPFLVNSLAKEEKYLKTAPLLGETIPFLQYICEQQSSKLALVYIPSRNQISDYYLPFEKEYCLACTDTLSLRGEAYQIHQKILKEQCNTLNIPFIDLTPAIKAEEEKGNHLYWDYDQHMKATGYLFAGETIKRTWESKH